MADQPDRPAHWPDDVQYFQFNDLDKLGVDGEGRFCWDGKRIAYDLKFTFWQKVGAFITVVSVGVAGLNGLFDLAPRLRELF